MSQKSVSDLVASSSWEAENLSPTALPLIENFQNAWLENSTAQQDRLEEIRHKTEALFKAAKEQHFEDGMESEFSSELTSLVEKYGDVVLKAIADFAASEIVGDEVVSEALRWLGRMDHDPTYHSRLWLLERSLFNPSVRIRDGAVLGLASIDDPHAITYLKQALQREKHAELRDDLTQVLTQLEASD